MLAVVGKFLETVPAAWRGLLAVVAALSTGLSVGWAANVVVGNARSLPARVERLERDHNLGLAYLICRAIEEDEGRDPAACRARMRGLDDLIKDLAR